jgi:hypothetical protein
MPFLTNKPLLASKSFAGFHGGTGAARPKLSWDDPAIIPPKDRSLVFKKLLKRAVRRRTCESFEGSRFRKILRRANESAPGGAGQRAAHAHAPDAEISRVSNR